jgi:hypothetical protein
MMLRYGFSLIEKMRLSTKPMPVMQMVLPMRKNQSGWLAK